MSLAEVIRRAIVPVVLSTALGMPAQAQEQPKERTPEEYAALLKGGMIKKGWLDHLQPKNASADQNSDYRKALDGITEFLLKYDKETLPDGYKEWHQACVEALIQNLFVENYTAAGAGEHIQGINERIRDALKKEGVMNYGEQLQDLVTASDAAVAAAKTDPEQRSTFSEYCKQLVAQAESTVDVMLATRYQPSIEDVDDKALEEIIQTHKKAYDALKGVQKALGKKDAMEAVKKARAWASAQSKGFEQLLELQEKASAGAIYATGQWATVNAYIDGKVAVLTVTKQFADEWGERGEKMYGPLEHLRKNVQTLEGKNTNENSLSKRLEYAVDFANNIPKDALVEGRVPTVHREAVVPIELADMLRGNKLKVQIVGEGECTYPVVGFSNNGTIYLTGQPGLFLPKDITSWKIEYWNDKYADNAPRHSVLKK
ncbi:MAG TPA: hypothetical protein VJH88_03595 [Candidatus Nanoarchaeia archaeon]|nr:hypothetical protein [Candidatus Nanoarchaeia archaeon]